MAHKVVFLDIDGVICVSSSKELFDSTCLKNLKEILDKTNARIVISSSWRLSEYGMNTLRYHFAERGIGEHYFLGATPDFSATCPTHNEVEVAYLRHAEIIEYVKQHKIKDYVIIDDFDLSAFDDGHFVKAYSFYGITDDVKKHSIRILSQTKP